MLPRQDEIRQTLDPECRRACTRCEDDEYARCTSRKCGCEIARVFIR